MKYNSHIVKFIHLKYILQWFLDCSSFLMFISNLLKKYFFLITEVIPVLFRKLEKTKIKAKRKHSAIT